MCHNIFISGCDMDFDIKEDRVEITATLSTNGQTGIEMEALTAVSIAAYRLRHVQGRGQTMRIQNIRLLQKTEDVPRLDTGGNGMKKGIESGKYKRYQRCSQNPWTVLF